MSDNENTQTEQSKVKKNIGKIIVAVCVVGFVLLFIICQAYIMKGKASLSTEIALSDHVVKSVPADMFIVRDEKIVAGGGSNVVSVVKDGTRVGVNDTVAYSFGDSTSAGNVIRMNEISELLNYYNSLSSKSALVTSDTTALDNRIIDDLCGFASTVSSGDFTSLTELKNELRDAITSKQTATGTKLDLSGTISALQSEYSALQSATAGYSEIKSGGTGYYISGSDGYENLLTYSEVDNWTIGDVENAISASPSQVSSESVGRVVHGYYWYLACVVDTGSISGLKVGNKRTISFPDSAVPDISTQVYAINADNASGNSLVIFRCSLMNEDIASLRCESALINIEDYNGYKVDNKAIRVNEENETGVYVVTGSVIRFKKVNIVYSAEDYSIVTNPYKDDVTMSGKYLNLYDEYIIEGTDLYDGKLIN